MSTSQAVVALKKNQVGVIAGATSRYPTYVMGLGSSANGEVRVYRPNLETRTYESAQEHLTAALAEGMELQGPKGGVSAAKVEEVTRGRLESDKEHVERNLRESAPSQPREYLPDASRRPEVDAIRYISPAHAGKGKDAPAERVPVRVLRVIHDGAFAVVTLDLEYMSAAYEAGAITRCHGLAIRPWQELYSRPQLGTVSLSRQMRPDYMRLDYYKMTLAGLQTLMTTCHVIDTPRYQRGYTWTLADKKAFISSLLHGRDVGKFAFVLGRNNYDMEILDGKQRCEAIMAFIGSHFSVDGVFYEDLDPISVRTMMGLCIDVAQITDNAMTELMKMNIFLDINDTGVPQSQEHLQKVRDMARREEALAAKA